MTELYEMKEQQERFVLVGVAASDNDDTVRSMEELEELAATAGALTVGKIIQNRESIHPGTYIGKGKIDEVRALALETAATGVVCDDELSPAQLKNLEGSRPARHSVRPRSIRSRCSTWTLRKFGKLYH
jgi:GTP-binding protein HflX